MQPMYKGIAFSPDTTLSKAITSTDTTIYVTNPNLLPDAPNYATIGTIEDTAETILYTGKTSTSLTGCTRGVEGISKAWTAGEVIARNYTNKDHDAFIENINEKSNATNLENGLNGGLKMAGCKSIGERNLTFGNNNTDTSQELAPISYIGQNSNIITVHLKKTLVVILAFSGLNIGDITQFFDENSNPIGKASVIDKDTTNGEWEVKLNLIESTGNITNTKYIAYFQAIEENAFISGCYNKGIMSSLVIIGNGTSAENRTNAFRVDKKGNAYGQAAFQSTGADYAEYYEWLDKNPNNDDRVGLFVTFAEGSKIRIANGNDNYILGVVSGNPSVIGNSYNDQWSGTYLKDHFDRIIYEEVDGEMQPKINPEYNPTKPFIGRAKRAEWATIGTHGQLSVYDDGSCQVDGYCKSSDNGIATSAKKGANNYRVIERLTPNIIKIQIK